MRRGSLAFEDTTQSGNVEVVRVVTFARRLRLLREEKGLSQIELSQEVHLSNSTISQYETTDRLPETPILQVLADFFGVPIDYLLGRTDQRTTVAREGQAPYGEADELKLLFQRGDLLPEDRAELLRYAEWLKERRKRKEPGASSRQKPQQ